MTIVTGSIARLRLAVGDHGMPLTATDLPAEVDALGIRFMMQHFGGPVRCHVLRATLDHLGSTQVRGDGDALLRFTKHRQMLEAMASAQYDSGRRSPWIGIDDLFAGMPSPSDDD